MNQRLGSREQESGKQFDGFSSSKGFSPFPNELFSELLTEIDNLAELKVTLYALWLVANREGASHPLFMSDFIEEIDAEQIAEGLKACVERGSLLRVTLEASEDVYFINSPRGRASAKTVQDGQWLPSPKNNRSPLIRSNIFKLYEENIGALTPLIAETLKDAEEENERIAEAIELAVKANARSWRYVEVILKRWKEEGYGKKQNRQDDQKNRSRYTKDKYADFFD